MMEQTQPAATAMPSLVEVEHAYRYRDLAGLFPGPITGPSLKDGQPYVPVTMRPEAVIVHITDGVCEHVTVLGPAGGDPISYCLATHMPEPGSAVERLVTDARARYLRSQQS